MVVVTDRPSLVLLAVLVFAPLLACSGGDDDGDVDAATDEGVLTLDVETPTLVSGEAAAWVLTVTNEGAAPVVLTFRSGQDGDVVLRDGDEVAYRWSEGRAFTLAIREVTLAPGEARDLSLAEEALDVPAGAYEMEVLVASSPAPPSRRQAVSVET